MGTQARFIGQNIPLTQLRDTLTTHRRLDGQIVLLYFLKVMCIHLISPAISYFHGHVTASGIEIAHAAVKKWLSIPTGKQYYIGLD